MHKAGSVVEGAARACAENADYPFGAVAECACSTEQIGGDVGAFHTENVTKSTTHAVDLFRTATGTVELEGRGRKHGACILIGVGYEAGVEEAGEFVQLWKHFGLQNFTNLRTAHQTGVESAALEATRDGTMAQEDPIGFGRTAVGKDLEHG